MLELMRGTPEEVGIPSESIVNFVNRLERYHVPMHSVLLMRNDKLVAEGYYAPCTKKELHRMFSISKSLTSLAIGKLAEEGRISLEDKICKYFPEYVPPNVHPWIASMTIKNMLMMRTCHAATTYKLDMNRDWVQSFFITPPTHKPGTIFHYDTSSSHTLCALVEKLTGKPMLHYLKEVMLGKLGFSEDSYMLKDPFGNSLGGSGLMATSEDMLRLGCLLLHQGKIDGEQLISEDYLKEACGKLSATMPTGAVLSESQGYGYQIWREEYDSIGLYGMGGQLVLCHPKENLICVTTADTQGMGGGTQLIISCFYEEILSRLSETPLPENREERIKMESLLSGLELSPLCRRHVFSVGSPADSPAGSLTGSPADSSANLSADSWAFTGAGNRRADRINGRSYRLEENGSGLRSASLDLKEKEGILKLNLAGRTCEIPFGYEKLTSFRFPGYDMNSAASGIWLDEDTFYIRIHLLDTSVGSVHIQLVFGEEDVTLFMKKQEETLFAEYEGHFYGKCEKKF